MTTVLVASLLRPVCRTPLRWSDATIERPNCPELKSIEDSGDLKKSFCLLPEERQHDVVKALINLFNIKEDFDPVSLDTRESA